MTSIAPPLPSRLRLGLSSGALYPHVASEEAPLVAARLGVSDLEVMLQTAGEYDQTVVNALKVNAESAATYALSVET